MLGQGTLSSGSDISEGSGNCDSHGIDGVTEAQKGNEVHAGGGWAVRGQVSVGIGQHIKEVILGQGS